MTEMWYGIPIDKKVKAGGALAPLFNIRFSILLALACFFLWSIDFHKPFTGIL